MNYSKELWLPIASVLTTVAITVAAVAMPTNASAAFNTVWDQGFETDTNGWEEVETGASYGDIVRVASGTDGIVAAEGDHYAKVSELDGAGPFSRFDEYRDEWTGEWVAAIDVYLDPAWEIGSGFDYAVAANGADGNHQRDFIFHVAQDESADALLVGTSNNTSFEVRDDLESIDNYEVTEAGWYTIEHRFADEAGVLSVTMSLLDDEGTTLFSDVKSDAEDVIPDAVGGNRYTWFTAVAVADGLAVDAHMLTATVPFEAALAITAPEMDEVVSGEYTFTAEYTDEDGDDTVQWAVRAGSCEPGAETLFGNVADLETPYEWDGEMFSATIDTSSLEAGDYCFVVNPTEDDGDTDLRAAVMFTVDEEVEEPTDPMDKNECKAGGYEAFGFKNQGQCIKYVNTGKDSR